MELSFPFHRGLLVRAKDPDAFNYWGTNIVPFFFSIKCFIFK
jgi:hypothetical protein